MVLGYLVCNMLNMQNMKHDNNQHILHIVQTHAYSAYLKKYLVPDAEGGFHEH
jgi:hypothetical protein